jgi:hypothetical protein
MSDYLKVAMVVEGPTDMVVIDAAISQIIGARDYVPTRLQPDSESSAFGRTGTGWGGVFRWCQQVAGRGGGSLSGDDLIFKNYDVLIIHLDADVAGQRYGNANIPLGFDDLPCGEPCPPASDTTDALRRVLLNWAGETQTPARTVLCIPSKTTEAWVLVALFPNDKVVRSGDLECLEGPESRLKQQPKGRRIRKTVAEYERRSKELQQAWERVMSVCTEARRFNDDLKAAIPP